MKNWIQRKFDYVTTDHEGDVKKIRLALDHRTSAKTALITIDVNDLEYLLTKAIKSKGRRATDCGGAVVVKIAE